MLEKAEGIVLRTINYGESNVILTLFTREFGKVAVMARGAKKTRNRFRSVSQPFVHGIFLYYKGRGMSTLNQGDVLHSFPDIRQHIVRMSYAAYMAELLEKTVEEREKNPYLFELFLTLLEQMEFGHDPEVLTSIFETKMTLQAGIQPELTKCVCCGQTDQIVSFSVKEAGFLCKRCTDQDPYAIHLHPKTIYLLRLFLHIDVQRIGSISLQKETKEELKRVMDAYYEAYGGFALKSKRFLDQLEKWNW